eukprot:7740392-Prorocentrum_lima.AAC.1
MTITALVASVGSSSDEMKKFRGFRKLCLETFRGAGSRDCRCPWTDFEKKLEYEERSEINAILPEDEFLPWLDYVEAYGDPRTNGHGHNSYTLDGVSGVLVPVSKRTRIQRKKSISVASNTQVDSSSMMQLGDDQI